MWLGTVRPVTTVHPVPSRAPGMWLALKKYVLYEWLIEKLKI